MFRILLSLAIAAQFFVGCGSESSSSDSNLSTEVKTGVFYVTKPVANLGYSTRGYENQYTNAKGEFTYYKGEDVTFSVAGVELGSAPGRDILNPFNLVPGSTEAEDSSVATGVALLMSLDSGAGAGDILTLDNAVKVYQYAGSADLTSISGISSFLTSFSTSSGTTQSYGIDAGTAYDAYDYISNYLATDKSVSEKESTSILDSTYNLLFGDETTTKETTKNDESSSILNDAYDYVTGN